MLETMAERLARLGFAFPDLASTRSLRVASACGRLEALVVRSNDVPTYVGYGAADLGVVGKDVLEEQDDGEPRLYELLDLGFGACRLIVATPGGARPEGPVWRVATKYPNVAERHFQSQGRPVEIIKLYGSVELAPLTGLADAIVDLVETGSTLAANGLSVIETILGSTARLIANRVSFKVRDGEIGELVAKLEGQLS